MQTRKLALGTVLLGFLHPAFAAPKVSTPQTGKERKAILDTLRVPLTKLYHQRPTFSGVGTA